MLKRIHVHDLTLGMFIHEFCGSWMEHPFWRTRFLLTSAQDLQRIRATTIQEVWIDTTRGRDTAAGAAAVTRDQASADAQALLEQSQQLAAQAAAPPLAPTTMAQELQQAIAICSGTRAAVADMFHAARMGQAVDVAATPRLVDGISTSMARNPHALISLARLKTANEYTYMHSVAVCALMVALARQIGLDEATTRLAGQAGLLHDLGKARVPQQLLDKPGKLTDAEFDVVRRHPVAGHELLAGSGLHPQVLDACLHHHEKIDGSGYPHRQAGAGISLLARMAAVCDVYDAITSDRPYKRGWDPALALHRMAEWSRSHFDNLLFQAFVKAIGIYPVGALVRLQSERLGVVVAQSEGALLAPHVKVFFSTRTGRRIPEELVDLAQQRAGDRIAAREDPRHWPFGDLAQLWSGRPSLRW